MNPRTPTAQLLELTVPTKTPGIIRSRSGMFVAPNRRMSSWVRTEMAAGVCQISSGCLDCVVISTSPNSSRLRSFKVCAEPGIEMHKRRARTRVRRAEVETPKAILRRTCRGTEAMWIISSRIEEIPGVAAPFVTRLNPVHVPHFNFTMNSCAAAKP